MSVLQRTIKLSLATVLAIWVADQLGLAYGTSAGIIAILSLLDTRHTSFKVAGQRLLSTILALAIGWLSFTLVGFNLWTIGIYMALYVPLAYHWELEVGIAPSTVLVTHIFLEQSLSWTWLVNELALFVIGAGVALLFNSYMPSQETTIQSYHVRVEQQLKAILLKFQEFLLKGDGTNEAQLIEELDQVLSRALKVVYRDRHNQVFQQTNYQVHYFEMRSNQNRLLRQMAQTVQGLDLQTAEATILAQLFQEVASQLSQANSGLKQMDEIDAFVETFRQRELPKTREEFENRAILFQLLNDMKRFIQLKVDFYSLYKD
ncbi:aromatic acid exporter family protein [Streptococcus caprae]|uniref:Aromatic acid exporter family protein n=1 Tax=Streptococcus caprae TaxID=1640501 RepID=A0ABV8CZ52_9STRE